MGFRRLGTDDRTIRSGSGLDHSCPSRCSTRSSTSVATGARQVYSSSSWPYCHCIGFSKPRWGSRIDSDLRLKVPPTALGSSRAGGGFRRSSQCLSRRPSPSIRDAGAGSGAVGTGAVLIPLTYFIDSKTIRSASQIVLACAAVSFSALWSQ